MLRLIDTRRASINRYRPKLNLDPRGLKLPSHFLSSLDFTTSQYDSRASVSHGASRLDTKARVTTCRKQLYDLKVIRAKEACTMVQLSETETCFKQMVVPEAVKMKVYL